MARAIWEGTQGSRQKQHPLAGFLPLHLRENLMSPLDFRPVRFRQGLLMALLWDTWPLMSRGVRVANIADGACGRRTEPAGSVTLNSTTDLSGPWISRPRQAGPVVWGYHLGQGKALCSKIWSLSRLQKQVSQAALP